MKVSHQSYTWLCLTHTRTRMQTRTRASLFSTVTVDQEYKENLIIPIF